MAEKNSSRNNNYTAYARNTLNFALKNKLKIIFVAVFFTFVLLYVFLTSGSSDKKPVNGTNIQRASSVGSNITSKISPTYRRKLEEQTKIDEEKARQNNSSFLPSVVGLDQSKPHEGTSIADGNFSNEGEAKQVSAPVLEVDSKPATDAPSMNLPDNTPSKAKPSHHAAHVVIHHDFISEKRYEMLKSQMELAAGEDEKYRQALDGSIAVAAFENAESSVPAGMNAGTGMNAGGSGAVSASANDGGKPSFSMPVDGTSWRGHFIRTMDSREAMRVFGQIDSGPYRGSMVLGTFAQNGMSHKITIRFDEIVYKFEDEDGEIKSGTAKISAVAIDPSKDSMGFADYVNRHMLEKILFPLATSFASGVGQAISQSGSSAMMSASGGSVISQGMKNTREQLLQAMGTAGSQMGSVLQQLYGNQPDVIKVFSGHPFLMVFDGRGGDGN